MFSSSTPPLVSLAIQERFTNVVLNTINNKKDHIQSLDFSCENLTDNDAIAIASILSNSFKNDQQYTNRNNNNNNISINNCTPFANTTTIATATANTTTTSTAINDSTTNTKLMTTNNGNGNSNRNSDSNNNDNNNTDTNMSSNNALKNLCIESINIAMNPFITTIGLSVLCDSFIYHTSITKLCLVNCNIDYNKSIILSNMISSNTTNIQTLYLADNLNIDINGIIHIINACINTTIQHLNIQETIHSYSSSTDTDSNCTTDSTDQQQSQKQQQQEKIMMKKQLYTSFIQLFKTNCTLQQLNLSRNGLDDTFIEHLSYGLQYNTTLTQLVLWDNNIGDVGAICLSKVLSCNNNNNNNNSALCKLYLAHNNIGDSGIQHIASSLHYNTILQTLDISENSFTIVGIYNLLQCIEYNESLVRLDISGIAIPKEIRPTVCTNIVQSLQYNDTIHHVSLTSIDDDTIDTILQQNYDQKRIAYKKGQRQLHDTISWLLHYWNYM